MQPVAAPLWRHPEFARGARDMVETALGIAAWGLLTGVAMAKSELPTGLAVLMSLIVFAGSAQLTALPLLSAGAPLWVIWATALCVNLRFVVFSAGWRRYFGPLPRAQRLRMAYFSADLNYALFLRRFPEPPPLSDAVPYFWGGVALNWLAWQLPSLAGIFLGDLIPTAWGLGFAGTLALLALVFAMLGDRASWAAAGVAGAAAVAAYGLPLKLNILVAIAAAVAIGLLVERLPAAPPKGTP
ncbi:MAG: AzlC family ABC transporter permease [Burkholderiales bacterium]|nr:AzlC family ABC transporter permease [Burkholderiales bacterium]